MADLVGLFNLLAPFFGLIGLGFLCGRLSRQPFGGLAWMQFFIIYVALPCLFYALIADKPLTELANWRFILVTTLCTAIAFAISFAVGLWHARGNIPQAVMGGVAGSYSNIGYMGPPLILSAIGPAASAPVALIFVFDSIFLFSVVPLLMAAFGPFEPTWTYAAVLMAALPPALNIFVIATQYNIGVERASACVLLGTLVSMATLTAFLYVIKTGWLPYDLFP